MKPSIATALGWLLALCLSVSAAHAATAEEQVVGKSAKQRGLLQNEDATNFFYYHDIRPGQAGQMVDRYVDVLAGAGVTVLLCNTNARRTNYRSDVWQAFWDGYDPDGPDDQPFLATIPKDDRQAWRKLVGNMLEVHRQGVDYPARVIERSRHRGISPWITLRMNDVHYNDNLDHPFHSPFWRRPELFRQGDPGYFGRALDYAHPEVRDHYRALIVETLARYDVDGLELDFMREPYCFSMGKEPQGRSLLTAWLREIRKLTDEAGRRRGHQVKLGVRVPSSPQAALGLGFDAPTWAREGLVDLVVVTPRWATLQFDMPLAEWRQLLGDAVSLGRRFGSELPPFPQCIAAAGHARGSDRGGRRRAVWRCRCRLPVQLFPGSAPRLAGPRVSTHLEHVFLARRAIAAASPPCSDLSRCRGSWRGLPAAAPGQRKRALLHVAARSGPAGWLAGGSNDRAGRPSGRLHLAGP